jgi:F0F1-type ATP synthase assembly protein I
MVRVQKGPPWKGLGTTERPMAVSYGLIAAILVFGAAGYVLDRTLDTSPWLLIGGIGVGLIVGFYALATLLRDRTRGG